MKFIFVVAILLIAYAAAHSQTVTNLPDKIYYKGTTGTQDTYQYYRAEKPTSVAGLQTEKTLLNKLLLIPDEQIAALKKYQGMMSMDKKTPKQRIADRIAEIDQLIAEVNKATTYVEPK